MKLKVELKACRHGKGLFATEPIQEGELVFFVCGKIVTFEEGLTLPCGGDHSVQIGPNLYVDPDFPSKFTNHSCNPSCGIRDDLAVVAIREIQPGEEINFDYSTCIQEGFFRMQCHCGEPTCRGEIGDFGELPDELKLKYIRMGMVQPFIMDDYFKTRRRSVIAEVFREESGVAVSPKPQRPPGALPTRPAVLQPLSPLGKI